MKEEEVRSALDGASRETLADALAMVLTEGRAPSTAAVGRNRPELANFAQAVMYMKKEYAFAELDKFTTEADLVYVQAGDRRVLLTDRMNERERARSYASESGEGETGEPGGGVRREEEEKNQSSGGNSVGRFSHLEF